MNILISSNVHWWNAEAAYAAAIAVQLKKAGHQVYVLTLPNTLNEKKLQQLQLSLITDVPLNTNNPFQLFQAYFKLAKWIKILQVHIVNPHRSEGFFLYVLLSWRYHSFALIKTRGTTRYLQRHWLNQKLYRNWVDALVFPGEVVWQRLQEVIPLNKQRKNVIYYPIDIPKTRATTNYYKVFQLPDSAKTLAIVGRIRPVKGQRLLLRSFKMLCQQFPRLYLFILYRDTNEQEPELQKLKTEISQGQLADRVRLEGYREDIREIMRFVDAGVISSLDSEVICRVAVEFFSVATPVVALPTGCLPEIVIDGKNGKLARNQSVTALTEAISWMLADPLRCIQLGQQALEDAKQRFSPQVFCEKTLQVYEDALSRCHIFPQD